VGEQACGDVGPGRLVEPEKIIELIKSDLHKGPLSGKIITYYCWSQQENK
jgi:phosphopantothenoylcysteine decarboxylase/phosphopantothenate--cysteine ligase